MKKVAVYGSMFLLAMTLGSPRTSADQRQKTNQLMIDKLRFAKSLLEAVSKDDYAKIAKNAQQLIVLSNKAEWRVNASPRYKLHSDAFREAASNLKKQAMKKKADGVAFAYVELTLTCLRCHKTVRAVQDAGFNTPDLRTEN